MNSFLFVDEDNIASGIHVISVAPDTFSKITEAADRFLLDFDGAYQYAVAEQHGFSIVSFDKDFDRTEIGRMEPKDLFS
ncbi:MAG: PIN domain-containing protein [Methanoregula sp.]|nr:PIN domain-containing protein [Methanoregula sp.]